jgi:hypothetical protein
MRLATRVEAIDRPGKAVVLEGASGSRTTR